MAGDVAGELAAVGVPAGVALGLLRQAGALAIEREHAIGLERQQVGRVEVLRVLERAAGEPDRGERQRPRRVGDGELDLLREARRHQPRRAAGDQLKELRSVVEIFMACCLTCHLFPLLFVGVDVVLRDDVDAGVDDRRRRILALLDVAQQLHRLAAPAEILLAEQHLHLAFAQQIERGADGVERDHLGLRRIDGGERVAREHRPAADGDPRREVRIAARAGGDDLGAADHVFLDVVGLDDLDARRLRERFLHAVEPILQVGGAEARDDRDLALAVQQLDRLLAQDAARREIVDAVERDALRLRRVGIPRRDRECRRRSRG